MTDDFTYEEGLMQMGLDRRDAQGRLTPVYHLPLTQKCTIRSPAIKTGQPHRHGTGKPFRTNVSAKPLYKVDTG